MRVGKTSRPESVETARWRALRLLERRPQSERELSDKLRRRGFEPAVVDEAVRRLKASGLVDDAAFAGAFARARVARKPVGRRLVAAQLSAKGVERHLAEAAAGTAVDAGGEAELAAAALAKYLRRRPLKFAGRRGPEAAKERQRLYGWLMRQGFDAATIRKALAGRGEEPDDLG